MTETIVILSLTTTGVLITTVETAKRSNISTFFSSVVAVPGMKRL